MTCLKTQLQSNTGSDYLSFFLHDSYIKAKYIKWIVTKVQTRKQTGTLSLSLYKAVMYLECSPFLEKERDGGGPIALMCPFVAFSILPWIIFLL